MTPHDRAYISHLLADAERETWDTDDELLHLRRENRVLRARYSRFAIACLAFVTLCAIGLLAVMVTWRRIP